MKIFRWNFKARFTRKQLWFVSLAFISLILAIILEIISLNMKKSLESQQMADRWDSKGKSTQISCFISENVQVTPKQLTSLEHGVDAALQEISVTAEKENQKLWADAYSARGEITVESGKTSITGKAIGVGNDFFLFHPLPLLSGSYFSDDDLMQDYIILDEDAAWQLFGSNDITGMQVTIKGVPHIIKGVIKRDVGRMNEKAGNGQITFYLSYDSLTKYGTSKGINTFEIVMPNPISGFALKTIKEKIGIEETSIELVENTKRYSIFSLTQILLDFGTRSMNQKAIVYPYWENVARGYEDVLSLLLFWKILLLLIPCVILAAFVRYKYKHRTWDLKMLLSRSKVLFEAFILKCVDVIKTHRKFMLRRKDKRKVDK